MFFWAFWTSRKLHPFYSTCQLPQSVFQVPSLSGLEMCLQDSVTCYWAIVKCVWEMKKHCEVTCLWFSWCCIIHWMQIKVRSEVSVCVWRCCRGHDANTSWTIGPQCEDLHWWINLLSRCRINMMQERKCRHVNNVWLRCWFKQTKSITSKLWLTYEQKLKITLSV